ncbi:transcription factor HES-7.1-like [Heteronotia binoei]|uniref:transcription factor HES-7.1-like n=1 Tax=Heteronotia binoei TaxID=13085 RepID=UPI00292F1D2F|nr:transcription factor HES-7.1-like [Heteronotia binoei]
MSLRRAQCKASVTGTQVLRGYGWRRPQLEPSKRLVYKKIIKPLMEKRRWDRIAQCLRQLKTLLVDDPGQSHKRLPNSRMDKAAVLEMTVQRIQTLQLAGLAEVSFGACSSSSTAAEDKAFHAGYSYCASLARAFLFSETGQQPEPLHASALASSASRETTPPAPSKPEEISQGIEDTLGSAGLRCLARSVWPSIPNTARPQFFWRPWST